MTTLRTKSSLPYQMALTLHKWYALCVVAVNLISLHYKASFLPYPPGNYVSELLLVLLLMVVELTRICAGQKGNLIESVIYVLICLLFQAPCVLCYVYFIHWQTYVFYVEIPLAYSSLVFHVVEAVLGIFVMSRFLMST